MSFMKLGSATLAMLALVLCTAYGRDKQTTPQPSEPVEHHAPLTSSTTEAYEFDDYEALLHQQYQPYVAEVGNFQPPPVPAQPGGGLDDALPNERYAVIDWLIAMTAQLTPPSRGDSFGRIPPAPNPVPVNGVPPGQPQQGAGVGGGTHKFIRPDPAQPDRLYGTGGADPCVIVVVVLPDGGLCIFHFYADDDVIGELAKYRFPAGSTAYIGGGNNDNWSKHALAAAIAYFRLYSSDTTVYGIWNASGIWVDPTGKVYFKPDPAKTL